VAKYSIFYVKFLSCIESYNLKVFNSFYHTSECVCIYFQNTTWMAAGNKSNERCAW